MIDRLQANFGGGNLSKIIKDNVENYLLSDVTKIKQQLKNKIDKNKELLRDNFRLKNKNKKVIVLEKKISHKTNKITELNLKIKALETKLEEKKKKPKMVDKKLNKILRLPIHTLKK